MTTRVSTGQVSHRDLLKGRTVERILLPASGYVHLVLDGGEVFTIEPGFEWHYETQPSAKEMERIER